MIDKPPLVNFGIVLLLGCFLFVSLLIPSTKGFYVRVLNDNYEQENLDFFIYVNTRQFSLPNVGYSKFSAEQIGNIPENTDFHIEVREHNSHSLRMNQTIVGGLARAPGYTIVYAPASLDDTTPSLFALVDIPEDLPPVHRLTLRLANFGTNEDFTITDEQAQKSFNLSVPYGTQYTKRPLEFPEGRYLLSITTQSGKQELGRINLMGGRNFLGCIIKNKDGSFSFSYVPILAHGPDGPSPGWRPGLLRAWPIIVTIFIVITIGVIIIYRRRKAQINNDYQAVSTVTNDV